MARRSVAEFLESFVLPLVAGGEVYIRRPLTLADLEHFESDLPHATEALVAVDDARARVLANLVVRPPALVLDADELRLAAALHNVLFLSHPRTETWTVSRGAEARVAETARRLAAQPLTRSRTRVLARHALLHGLFGLSRADIKVSWWTGSARFLGQTPPARLFRWRGPRRVHEEVTTATYADLLATGETMPVVATLLRRSPLTQLLQSHPQAPAVHWEDAVFILRDAELARAVSYEALRPAELAAQVAAPARFAAAFEQLLERAPEPADVRAIAAFLVHLAGLLAVAEIGLPDRSAKSPLLATVLAPERAGQRPRGLTTFLALPSALARIDPRLAVSPGVEAEPEVARRWAIHREQVTAGVGEAVIDTLVVRLARHLGRRALLPPIVPAAPGEAPAPVDLSPSSH